MGKDDGNTREPRQKRSSSGTWWKIGLPVGGLTLAVMAIVGLLAGGDPDHEEM